MPLLLIDPDQALDTAADYLLLADRSEGLVHDLVVPATLSELAIDVPGPLIEMAETVRSVARAIATAANEVSTFRLPVLAPTTNQRWNHVRQVASHNTYQSPTGLHGLHAEGVRAFEFDLHRGAPTSRWIWQSPLELLADAVTHERGTSSTGVDWPVYHHSLDTESSHAYLSHALADIAALGRDEPITLFIDIKDPFGGDQTVEALDAMLVQRLGGRLFTPADLRAHNPASGSLQQSLDDKGWPTVAELDGRVIVVLTDEVEQYQLERPGEPIAFVAVPPTMEAIADPNIVFYNVRGDRLTKSQVAAIEINRGVIRSWGPPTRAGVDANYVALDL